MPLLLFGFNVEQKLLEVRVKTETGRERQEGRKDEDETRRRGRAMERKKETIHSMT